MPKKTESDHANRMLSLIGMNTGCHLDRDAVGRLVVTFVRAQGFPAAVEASDFDQDVHVDASTRAGWAAPLRQRVFASGCDPKGFGPTDCENAQTVGDIGDSLFEAIQ